MVAVLKVDKTALLANNYNSYLLIIVQYPLYKDGKPLC